MRVRVPFATRSRFRYVSRVSTQFTDLVGGDLDEFGALPTEERVRQSLASPNKPGALRLGDINKLTKTRIRYAFSQLLALEFEEVQKALREVQRENPARYIELVMELAQFSTPKLKAMELNVSDNSENAREMPLADLQRLAVESSVVSSQ